MPRFKPKGVLERSALADLWKHTLSRIPTAFGRLSYLTSLRDPNSGIYRHHGLSSAFGREESSKALKESHEQAFSEWQRLPLREKSGDLIAYLQELEDPPQVVVRHWVRSREYRNLIPATARSADKELFRHELEALLEIFKNDPGVAPAPGSTQSG